MLVKWRLAENDGKLLARLPEQIFCMAYDSASGRCAVGTRLGTIYEIEVNSNILIAKWQAHPESVFALEYLKGQLISAGNEGSLRVWNEARALERDFHLSDKSLRCLLLNKEELLIAGSEGRIWSLETTSWKSGQTWELSSNSVFSICQSDSTLYSAGRDAHIHLWNQTKRTAELEAHWYSIHALALSPDNKFLASGSMDKSIKIWDAQSGTLLKVIDRERYNAHTSSVNSIIWMDDTSFVSCSDDRSVMAFRVFV